MARIEFRERIGETIDLAIDIADFDRFLLEREYTGTIAGTIDGEPIAKGSFNILDRRAIYVLSSEGEIYEGTREIEETAVAIGGERLESRIDLDSIRVTDPPRIVGRTRTIQRFGKTLYGDAWRPLLRREKKWKLAAIAYWRELLCVALILASFGVSFLRRGIELGFELGFIALVGTSLLSSMAVWILLANVALGGLWMAARKWWPSWTVPIHLNRWVGHAEAILGWLTFAMVSTHYLPIQVAAAAIAILFGGKLLDRLAGARTKAPEDLLWARRPFIYFATLISLAALCWLAPEQRRTLGPLVVAIGAGMTLRAVVAWRAAQRPDHPMIRKIVLGESQHDSLVATGVLGVAGIVPLLFLGMQPGEAKGDRSPVCDAHDFSPDVSLFLISDSQFHELDGKRSGVHLDLADRIVPVAVRPIELDLLSESTLRHFGEVYAGLRKSRPSMKWAHVGDFGDLGCTLELDRLGAVFAEYETIGPLAGLAPGNHDSSFVGNFDWHPDWDAVCKEPSVRLGKEDSDARLRKLLPDDPSRRVDRKYHRPKFMSPFPGHGYLAMASVIGTTRNSSGEHPVIGIFIDSSDHGAFDIGVAGVVGSVSEEQRDFLIASAKELAGGKSAVHVLFVHHPFADLDWRGKDNVEDLVESLGNVLAVFSAHTHLSARVEHGKELHDVTEYVVGSTIDPPQEATLLDIGPDKDGKTVLRVETIPAIARPNDVPCTRATAALPAIDCDAVLERVQKRCPEWLSSSETRTPETSDRAPLLDVFPNQVKRDQKKRAHAMLECFAPGISPKDPLDDNAVFSFIRDHGAHDELVCASWAASIVQAYKHTDEGPHTIAQALHHLHDRRDGQLAGSKVWVKSFDAK